MPGCAQGHRICRTAGQSDAVCWLQRVPTRERTSRFCWPFPILGKRSTTRYLCLFPAIRSDLNRFTSCVRLAAGKCCESPPVSLRGLAPILSLATQWASYCFCWVWLMSQLSAAAWWNMAAITCLKRLPGACRLSPGHTFLILRKSASY